MIIELLCIHLSFPLRTLGLFLSTYMFINYYIFPVDCPRFHYKMFHFIAGNVFGLK